MTAAATLGEPELSAGSSGRRRWIIATAAFVVAVVVLIAGLGFVHWRDGLRLFPDEGNEIGTRSLAVGHSFYVGDQFDGLTQPVRIDFDAITPEVTANSADAIIRVLLCVQGPNSVTIGAVDSLAGVCDSARPFSSGRYLLAPYAPAHGAVAVILQITPKRAGHVHVAGLHVHYHRGLRHGDQITGIEIDTRTP